MLALSSAQRCPSAGKVGCSENQVEREIRKAGFASVRFVQPRADCNTPSVARPHFQCPCSTWPPCSLLLPGSVIGVAVRHNAVQPAACRAKAGGSNPNTNRQLHNVMDSARKAGVPKDIVERNLKRADSKDVEDIAEHLIEVYGPGGSGFIMDCLTDNKQRAATDIWTVVKKLNGKMANAGSVLFNFERRGEITLEGVDEDTAFDAAMQADGEDVEPYHDEDGQLAGFKVVSTVDNFGKARDALNALDVHVKEEATKLSFKPLAVVEVQDEDKFHENMEIFDRCLELDDVDAIYTTCAGLGSK